MTDLEDSPFFRSITKFYRTRLPESQWSSQGFLDEIKLIELAYTDEKDALVL